jgi:serine/threonine protein kinase
VCGHRIEGQTPAPAPVPGPAASRGVAPTPATGSALPRPGSAAAPPGAPPAAGAPVGGKVYPPGLKPKPVGDPYLGQTLNSRFRVESKIGEGGFGSVYRGVQLATGRKVALKLLHPEMTKDENLVARFRREGLVLCNLRDAHTITTYDFDQTPDGTLYIAMELLEGKSLHQVFHDEAPIEWRRMFKIQMEMCSSLAEAHAQGIVHRDLKPENVYLETRPGNPEFVKILDFGIAKVMRGDGSVDPHAPQLTATGQTLGTLEYMSPEQLMGKQLDGRSDVYALGVVAYELITGRLPFPDAKGPAGLITAQLKQTPPLPSSVSPGRNIPSGVDRVILTCLEKDKNKRFPDVTQLAAAMGECVASGGQWGAASGPAPAVLQAQAIAPTIPAPTFVPTTPAPSHAPPSASSYAPPVARAPEPARPAAPPASAPQHHAPLVQAPPPAPPAPAYAPPGASYPGASMSAAQHRPADQTGAATREAIAATRNGVPWLWIVLGLLAVGAGVGAVLAFAT